MKYGSVLHHINTVLIMGVAGSGKTSVKDLLLDNPPKGERSSTPSEDQTLNVQPVTSHLIQTTGHKWQELSQQDKLHQVAQTIKSLQPSSLDKVSSDLQSRLNQLSVCTVSTDCETSIPPSLLSPVQQAMGGVVDGVVAAMTQTSESYQKIESEPENELLSTKSLRLTNIVEEPPFLDIASLFFHNAANAIFMMRLTDEFDDVSFDDSEGGKLVSTPTPLNLSYGKTIMSLLPSFLSHHNLIFIGTFLDKLKDSKVVLEVDKRLREILPQELNNKVVYSSLSMDKMVFALNACSRDSTTHAEAEEIRKAIETYPSLDAKIPLWWLVLELSMQNLCSLLERSILSKKECVELVQNLGYHPDALEAALVYFNEIGIFCYYPDILPHLIFVDPQVPLHKVSELIQYAVSLRNKTVMQTASVAMAAKWKRFANEGILMIDMLESAHFQRHFKEALFSPANMITIMSELMIIAPFSATKPEFFMPTLLESVPPSELEKHRVFTTPADPLVIRFPNNCVPCGVFCCLVVFLIKKCEWHVILPSEEPGLLAKNCVKLRYPERPCEITLVDSFSYIEVHVNAELHVCEKLCYKIRKIIIAGIELANASLHYHNSHPVASIFCSHESISEEGCSEVVPRRHHADIYFKSGYWTRCCSRDINCTRMLEHKHILWFCDEPSTQTSSGESYAFILLS